MEDDEKSTKYAGDTATYIPNTIHLYEESLLTSEWCSDKGKNNTNSPIQTLAATKFFPLFNSLKSQDNTETTPHHACGGRRAQKSIQ
jgi:hypothetical protein